MDLTKPPRTYSVADFRVKLPKEAAKPAGKPSALAEPVVEIEPLPLPDDLHEVFPADPEWVEAIMTGQNPPGKNYASRSELVYASVIWMLFRGMQPGHVLSIIMSPDVGISAHVLENPNPLAYRAHRPPKRAARRGNPVLTGGTYLVT